MENLKYSLVIPIYKNEGNIEPLYLEILKLKRHIDFAVFEVILVVDGSPDQSDERIRRYFSTGAVNFKMIHHFDIFQSTCFSAIPTFVDDILF